jgi:glycosyltransferase involved in cell wall biosynthesis
MKIEYTDYSDFSELLERPPKQEKKVTLILPARGEHLTIGAYFPEFSKLMELGHINEVVIADSSDDGRTIDAALESAMETEPFASRINKAIEDNSTLPVKAVNVFDPALAKIFNGHRPIRGTAPGKGTAMYLGMAVATGDILIFLDSDFQNISPRFVYGLVGPFEDPKTILSKATFELEDLYESVVLNCMRKGEDVEDCETLMKSVNARTLARPITKVLDETFGIFPDISGFNGPLSGGCGAPRDLWESIMIPLHYGIEVSYLMQFTGRFRNGHCAYDVNLGEVVQQSQNSEGRSRMGRNIISTVLSHIDVYAPHLSAEFARNPKAFTEVYLQHARDYEVHATDAKRIELYAQFMEEMLTEGTVRRETPVLPPLKRNVYYLERRKQLIEHADNLMYDRLKHRQTQVVANDAV